MSKQTKPRQMELTKILSALEFSHKFEAEYDDDFYLKAMVAFAKAHVTEALKSAHKNMQLPDEDLEFTLNAYKVEEKITIN